MKNQDRTEIFYKAWGPRDGEVVVFHHGWPPSATGFAPQYPGVINADLPAFFQS